jgi:FkbM family methyltransferase
MKLATSIMRRFLSALNSILARTGYQLNSNNRTHDTVLEELTKLTKPAGLRIVFDVGAHNGESIERFKRIYGPNNCEIYAFEPSNLFDLLEKKYADNQTKIYNLAVSDENTEKTFYTHSSSTGSSSLEQVALNSRFAKRRNLGDNENIVQSKVTTTTIDEFCKKENIARIHHLKIDVQGHEPSVLRGASESLSNQIVDIIEVEVIIGHAYEKPGSFIDIEKYLIPNHYRLVSLSPDGRFATSLRYQDILKSPELQFDLIYCSKYIFDKIFQQTEDQTINCST